FGLDHSDTAGSVMNEDYGYHTGLSAEDVSRFQAMYGVRTADSYDAAKSNNTMAQATGLLPQVVGAGTRFTANGDITTNADADYYKFNTVGAILIPTVVTVRLQAKGLSLLTPSVTVYDSNGKVVASATSTDPTNNDLTLTFNSSKLLGTYYVKVA